MMITIIFLSSRAFPSQELPLRNNTCFVEVISDACGDGVVSLHFSPGEFVLRHGDVHCWYVPFALAGVITYPRGDHTGSAVTVDLVTKDENPELIGEITYQQNKAPKSSLATLKLRNSYTLLAQGAAAAVYHLKCFDNGQSCLEHCQAEGNEFFPTCHRRCGGW